MIAIKEIYSSIDIDAPPARVWQEFSLFQNFPKWNPFLQAVNVDLKTGKVWEKVFLAKLGSKNLYSWIPMQILNYKENEEISWCGRVPWILAIWSYGYHIFRFDSIGPNKTRFSHRCVFSGIFITLGLSIPKMANDVKQVQEEMNANLKALSEK